MIKINTVNDLFDLLFQKKIKHLHISANPENSIFSKYSITIELFDWNRVDFKNDDLKLLFKSVERYLNA